MSGPDPDIHVRADGFESAEKEGKHDDAPQGSGSYICHSNRGLVVLAGAKGAGAGI
jgi:hypothetical protein